MRKKPAGTPNSPLQPAGFTLVELLVVISVIAILAGLILPALAKAKGKGYAMVCLNNTRQLTFGWLMYADEFEDRLPYNLGGDPNRQTFAPKTPLNWVNNVMTWERDEDNTNTALITEASLGKYLSRNHRVYKCPSDRVVSDTQREIGWTERTRSYSMNAMLGHAGDLIKYGVNQNNPNYKQFFTLSSIPAPSQIFVFLDEHPDSINDGYFLNVPAQLQWIDLPASYHDGAGTFSFADGHVEIHKWVNGETRRPAHPDAGLLPFAINESASEDFEWVAERTSIARYRQTTATSH